MKHRAANFANLFFHCVYVLNNFVDNMLAPFYNVSKTYIDSFRLNDWVIYGSSRLGTQQASKPLVSVKFTANQTNGLLSNQQWLYVNDESELILDSFVLMRGQKAYELTNHLGNVLTTVSDKKVAVCTNGTFSHFGADVLSATDYSPFGAPLPGRNWQQLKPDAIAVNLPQGNITATTGWTTMFCSNPTTCISPEPSVTLSAVGGKLRMQTNKRYAQAYYTIATIPGRVYKIRYRLSGVTFSFTNISVFAPTSRVDLYVAPNLTPAAVNGIDQEVTFTATEGTTRFYLTRGWAATATTPTIETLFLDYLTIAEDWNYRFGFQNQERDDETYGSGNAYDFGARIYDPRLGKWLSTDPLQVKYPFISPYVFTLNKPIMYIDYDGRDIIPTNQFMESRYSGVVQKIVSNLSTLPTASKYIKPFLSPNNNVVLQYHSFWMRTGVEDPDHTYGQTQRSPQKLLISFNSIKTFTENGNSVSGEKEGYFVSEIGMVMISLHEFMHAAGMDSHNEIAKNREDIVQAILDYAALPNSNISIDRKQAEALSWVGLQESDEFIQTIGEKGSKTYEAWEAIVQKVLWTPLTTQDIDENSKDKRLNQANETEVTPIKPD